MASPPITAFLSYSRRDLRYLKRLEVQLETFRQQGLLDPWHDRCFIPGDAWEPLLLHKLATSDLILLLVSPDFLASDFIYRVELQTAFKRHEAGEARLVPVLLRPVDLTNHPLARLQWLPRDGRPVSQWRIKDQAWLDIQQGLRQVITFLQEQRQPSPSSSAQAQGSGQPSPSSPAQIQEHRQIALEHQRRLLYDALLKLNASMLDEVIFRSGLPSQHLSQQTSPAIRVRELLELAQARGSGILDLTEALLRVAPGAVPRNF